MVMLPASSKDKSETRYPLLSAFAGEAADSLNEQIQVLSELDFKAIDLRLIGGEFVHDLPVDQCRQLADQIGEAGIAVTSLASAIGAGRSQISDDPSVALGQARRCAERAALFAAPFVRVMSWIPPVAGMSRAVDEPTAKERFRRLREIVEILRGSGLEVLHENCNNYGGQSHLHTLRLLEEIPGMALVFDTANPIGTPDWSYPEPRPMQSTWRFWVAVRDFVKQIHIKDGCYHYDLKKRFLCLPGQGEGDVAAVLANARHRGFKGPISLEPHLGGNTNEERFANFVAAGEALKDLLAFIRNREWSHPGLKAPG